MPKTLLLADDSVTIQKVVGISFANEDVVLLTVDNGDDAIARTRDARPDVVLADVVMPGKNGYDVCAAIKADPALAHIPVLLLTGTFEAFDEQRAAKVGADGHITKPFEAQALVDKVNGLLARPAPGVAPAQASDAPSARAGLEIGAMRAQRSAAPPPQPVSHTADTAYDFFDEEITAPRGPDAPAQPTRATDPQPPREDTTVLLAPTPEPARSGGDAFGFAAPEPERVLPMRAPEPETPTYGGDDLALDLGSSASESGDSIFDDFDPPTMTSAPPVAQPAASPYAPTTPPLAAAPPASPTTSDAEWMARSEAPTQVEIGWDTSDGRPAASLGFDESGDVETPPALAWDADSAAPTSSRGAAVSDMPDWFAPPDTDLGATRVAEPRAARQDVGDPLGRADDLGDFALEADLESSSGMADAILDPHGGRDYDVSSSDLGAPLDAPTPLAREMPPAPSMAAAAPLPAAAALGASAAGAAISPADRRELHDVLEKMAWEAFGPVAENLVREAVERIERIAWEVIPQLAETLVREEIRKLKGE